MQFVDVTNDVAFRKIFGNENKKGILISFLNAVILLPNADNGEKIVDIKILNPHQLPNLALGRTTIIDISATDSKGNNFIIEMQVTEAEEFHKRVLYYTSQNYTSQIVRGKEYKQLSPVYFIGVLGFNMGNNPDYLSRHRVLDIKTGENIISDVEFNFISLPKFNKTEAELLTPIDKWVYFIKNAGNLDVIPDTLDDKNLQTAYIDAAKMNWTKQEYLDYIRMGIKEQDEKGKIELAERRATERGLKEGIEKGIEKGKTEALLSTAKKLLSMGLSLDEISQATGLSLDRITHLTKE